MEEVKLDPFLVQSQGKRLVVEVALNPVYRGGPVRTDAAARSEGRWLVAMKFPERPRAGLPFPPQAPSRCSLTARSKSRLEWRLVFGQSAEMKHGVQRRMGPPSS